MERHVRRDLKSGGEYEPVRIWTRPDHPEKSTPVDLAVEWHGPHGPTTFALLGGDLSPGPTTLDVDEDGVVFRPSPYIPEDTASFGLPAPYRVAVLLACPTGVRVSVAAHKPAGSSSGAFAIAAKLLARFLLVGIPDGDEEIRDLEQAFQQEVRSPAFRESLRRVTFQNAD